MKSFGILLKTIFVFITFIMLASCGGGGGKENDNNREDQTQTSIFFLAEKVTPKTELYATNVSGSNILRLNHVLPEFADVVSMKVSPNRKYVAYSATSGLSSVVDLYIVKVDGSSAYKVSGVFPANQLNGVGQFDWSPDSTKLAYLAKGQDNNLQKTLYIASINNEPSINITPQATVSSFLWSPNNNHIAYVGDKLNVTNSLGIYVVEKTTQVENKVSSDLSVNETVFNDAYFWAPDGSRLAYIKQSSLPSYELYTVNADGTEITKLSTVLSGMERFWGWAPDSSRLAYISIHATSGIYELFTIQPNGDNNHKISNLQNSNEFITSFIWSPDSLHIVYRAGEAGNLKELYTVSPDGTQHLKVSGPLANAEEVFANSISWAPNSKWISYLANPEGINSQLLIVKPDGTNLISVSNSEIFSNNVFAYPIWSPDSNHIAFQVSLQSGVKLYTFNPNDKTVIRFTLDTNFAIDSTHRSVKWLSDGRNLIYKAVPSNGFVSELYSASINTGLETNVTEVMGFINVSNYDVY